MVATLTSTPPSFLPLWRRKLPTYNPTQCLGTGKEALEISSNGYIKTNTIGFPEKGISTRPGTSSTPRPPRPRRIILVRHGESEGNVDETVYTRVPDPKIDLTEKGKAEAEECGWRIREMIEKDGANDWKVYFYVSPYKRTLETLRHLGLAFERSRISGMREEPRIREQDFGNFQDREKMRLDKALRLRYGRFFYRFPNGESAADVYDRITATRRTKPKRELNYCLTWPSLACVSNEMV
ncbi:hypothetical protein ES332_D12G272800v1 [Gossypium tomentosum]|uniref:Phosphoglycerate mutase (2,3-diphosphoglycerate-dependent) n=1 Tax=Gossypium tomentosum TaxID=34277 RepID=A0A5D2IFB9_GOSTO|nr:hypothetical protein ES332_D12G272800v1 [Gossypium tomentosum]